MELCSWHCLCNPPCSKPPCLSSTQLLPAYLPVLPLPPLNRLRQQDGTNLWLNSPKITRDLSEAVCVKLTDAQTLLSSALSSEAGPDTLLGHCPPVPCLSALLVVTQTALLDLIPKKMDATALPHPAPGTGVSPHSPPSHAPTLSGSFKCSPLSSSPKGWAKMVWPPGTDNARGPQPHPGT